MKVEDIRKTAIQGSHAYYNFLLENDKGIQEIEIYSLRPIDERKESFKLKLAKKLFDLDAVLFRFMDTKTDYDTSRIKIVQYDSDQNNLIVRPEKDLLPSFSLLGEKDLRVISDLKFLVERVRKWYEQNGGNLQLPKKISKFSSSWKNLQVFQDRKPSPNQYQALEVIFTNPFSYIWGAPGTGKTQVVLSYALLHYVKNKKKVAIFGPTNNAIEQVLRGVIEMTDRAQIDREQILRIGNPSKKFAEKYPRVCEVRGLEKQLKDIDRQIQLLKKIAGLKYDMEEIERTNTSLSKLDELGIYYRKHETYSLQIGEKKNELKKAGEKRSQLQNKKNSLVQRSIALENKSKSLIHSIGKIFSSSPSKTEKEILTCRESVQQAEDDIEKLTIEKNYSEETLEEFIQEKDRNLANARTKIEAIRALNNYPGTKEIVSDLSLTNYEVVKSLLQEFVKSRKEELLATDALASDYSQFPREAINDRLEILQAQRDAIASQSTEERLKNVSIVASTLDTYIGRFPDKKLEVDHIFLDEAGYANVAKALTLFHHDLPITFLGDHKQLPPVCELNDSDIQKNETYRDVFIWSQSALYLEGLFKKEKAPCLAEYLKNQELRPIDMVKADIRETFRFGPNLARVLDEHVYKNGFQSTNSNGQTDIYFVDAVMNGSPRHGRENFAEAQAIQQILSQFDTTDFAILTPYRKQLNLIGKLMPNLRNEQKILTVHGSQGREWHTVILSVSDTNNMWFTDSQNQLSKGLNLMNTAVSRAKKRLIIVCNVAFWKQQKGQLLNGLLSVASPFKISTTV